MIIIFNLGVDIINSSGYKLSPQANWNQFGSSLKS